MIKLINIMNEVLKGENKAPYGIMFFGDNKVLIGDNHSSPVELSQEIIDKVLDIAKKYGYYGEGIGIKHNKGVMSSEIYDLLVKSKAKYNGSWDDLIKIPKKEKYSYIATLFSNPKENNRVPTLMKYAKKEDTIFDLLAKTFDQYTQPGLNLTEKDLTKFLKDISEHGIDFLELSKQIVTNESLTSFVNKGEKLTWPKNWEEYPNKAGKLARRETTIRDEWIIKAGPGVYFIGNGHLKDIENMEGGKKIIGGEKIK